MEIVLLGLAAVLLIFMVFNSRRQSKKMKAQQEEKARSLVPGAKVLLQGGLYGTIVSYDQEDLDAPALVELAPGTVVEVHSQAVLRIVDPVASEDEENESEADGTVIDEIDNIAVETPEQTRARLEQRNSDDK